MSAWPRISRMSTQLSYVISFLSFLNSWLLYRERSLNSWLSFTSALCLALLALCFASYIYFISVWRLYRNKKRGIVQRTFLSLRLRSVVAPC